MNERMPDGQLCERIRNYAVHESHSAWMGERGALCPRPAKAKDNKGVWACGIHLGADKRGEQNRQRAAARHRWTNNARRKEAGY